MNIATLSWETTGAIVLQYYCNCKNITTSRCKVVFLRVCVLLYFVCSNVTNREFSFLFARNDPFMLQTAASDIIFAPSLSQRPLVLNGRAISRAGVLERLGRSTMGGHGHPRLAAVSAFVARYIHHGDLMSPITGQTLCLLFCSTSPRTRLRKNHHNKYPFDNPACEVRPSTQFNVARAVFLVETPSNYCLLCYNLCYQYSFAVLPCSLPSRRQPPF